MDTELFKQKQVANLYSISTFTSFTLLIVILAIIYILHEDADLQKLIIWSVYAISLLLFRFIAVFTYKKFGLRLLSCNQWLRLHFTLLLLSSLAWGGLIFLIEPDMALSQHLSVWLIVAFIVSGASASYATVISHYLAIFVPIFIISVGYLLLTETVIYNNFFIIISMYLIFTTINAFNVHKKETRVIKNELEMASINLELQKLASRDPLTNLMNRRTFDEYYQSEWERHKRSAGVISIILIDIDHFKNYNDYYGHDVGDKVLIHFANVLNKALHRPADSAIRYGGEEFLILLPDTTIQGAVEVAERIRKSLHELNIENFSSENFDRITVSMGVASIDPTSERDSKDLILAADKKLYLAKARGRDQICFNEDVTVPKNIKEKKTD